MKILLVCESFSAKLSGGKVARYLYEILYNNGHQVEVAVTGNFDEDTPVVQRFPQQVTAIPKLTRLKRLHSLLDHEVVPTRLVQLIEKFQPDVAHFASFDHTKSANLYYHCKSKGIRTALQPWTMHFFCAQGFGYRDNKNCQKCIDKGYLSALTERCVRPLSVFKQIERKILHDRVVTSADALLSSNRDLDEILLSYGISNTKLFRFPVAFDVSRVATPITRNGDYYIYYGQAEAHKGLRFVIDLFSRLPKKKLKIYPMAAMRITENLPPNIEIFNGLSWDNGLLEAISGAKAVLIPSLWKTSTEYSLCEAMAMKKPVVAFDIGAHKELLSHRKNAMVVNPYDAEQFLGALNELERDPELYARLSTGGAERIKEVNEPQELLGKLMAAYKPT